VEVVNGKIDSAQGVILVPGFNSLPVVVTNCVCFGGGDRSLLGPGNEIIRSDPSVKEGPCDKDQVGATCMGLVTGLSFVCKTCPCNAERALCHRHGVAAPPFTSNFDAFSEYLNNVFLPIQSMFVDYSARWHDAWMGKWPMARQRAFARSIANEPPRPGRVKAMVKREQGHSMPTKPRLIQYHDSLSAQALHGPAFFALQKAWTEWFQRREVFPGIRATFASGLNARALGQWMCDVQADYSSVYWYERDGKTWDATMQAAHLEVRLLAYACAGAEFVEFVRQGFKVRGNVARGPMKYKLTGTVKSGHNDTTMGNSLVNIAIACEVMRRMSLRGDVIAAGDDLLVAIDGDFDEAAFAEHERALGILPEYRKFCDARDVSFVSGIWMPIESGWCFTPKPGRLLARLFWTVKPPPKKYRQKYLNAIVLGLRPVCARMPVVGAFLDAHYDAGSTALGNWALVDKRLKVWKVGAGLDVPTAAVCDRYGISPDEIAAVESLFRENAGRVGILSHPVLDRIVSIDCAELADRPLTALVGA